MIVRFLNGKLVRVVRDAEDELNDLPISGAVSFEFDEDTNEVTARAIRNEPKRFSESGGVMLYDGSPVQISADGTKFTRRKQVKQFMDADPASVSLEQLARVVQFTLKYLIRRF